MGELGEIIERRWQARTFEGPNGETRISDLLFFREDGSPVRDFNKLWKSALKAAGLKAGRKVEGGKIFHDTRRSAATYMDRAGVLRAVCKKIMGHLTDIMFTRYRITENSDTREGLLKTEEYLKNLPVGSNLVQSPKAAGDKSE